MREDPAADVTEGNQPITPSENMARRSFVRNPKVLVRRDLHGTLLLVPEQNQPLLLDAIGALIWDVLEEPTTFEVLVGDIATAFQRPTSDIAGDIIVLLEHLMIVGALCVD